jgi:excisionase family DNA binding protein
MGPDREGNREGDRDSDVDDGVMQSLRSSLTCTVAEVALLLGISRSTAYACVRSGEIQAIRIGRRVVVPRRVIDALLQHGGASSPGTGRPPPPLDSSASASEPVARRGRLTEQTDGFITQALPPSFAAARMLGAMSKPRADDTLIELVRQRREEILAVARRRGAHNVRLFGSLARGEAHAGSDVDFLVDFDAGRSLLDVSGLILDLEELLGVRVDIVEASALRSGDAHVLDDAVSL